MIYRFILNLNIKKTQLNTALLYILPAGLLCLLAWLCARFTPQYNKALAYALFLVAPTLTLTGAIAPLTGFDGGTSNHWLFGSTFLTPFLALLLMTQTRQVAMHPLRFFTVCLNPIYMISGPIPTNIRIAQVKSWAVFKRRFHVYHRYAIVGAFFLFVAAPGFQKLLALKTSSHPVDTLLFGLSFEFYVYFNFAGYSLSAMALMRLLGLNAPLNFRQPFSATSVVEYWQRWHASLSNVLRSLFFNPFKKRWGTWIGVCATFMASAIWHGTTINFVLWGAFQASMWCLSRWLFLKNTPKVFQYVLLISSVTVGRVIFSEVDHQILFTKLTNLLHWSHAGVAEAANIITALEKLDLARIAIAVVILILEPLQALTGNPNKRYKTLRFPVVSTFLLLTVILFSGGDLANAVYGAR